MAAGVNRKVILTKRPQGTPTLECFDVVDEPIASPQEGELLLASEYISIDAFIRTTLHEVSMHPPVPIGGTLGAIGVGRVLESASPDFAAGDAVLGGTGAQTRPIVPAATTQKLDEKRAPARTYLGLLGMTTGLTAYFGMREVGQPKPGETVVVSAAAGAVGTVASQVAKLDGARVIGIAGGKDKVRYLEDELGLDAGIDYKGEDLGARLSELAPQGIDVFFDNVGGEQLDLVLERLSPAGARVVICGAISQYDHDIAAGVNGPRHYLKLAERNARMEGFTVFRFMDRYEEGANQVADWLDAGKIQMREQIESGIESFPAALIKLLTGGHTGKLLVDVT